MIVQKNILDLKNRSNLYDFIKLNPGLHLREISRRMNIPKTTIKYHLKYLKKLELIEENTKGKYKYFFVIQKIGREDKQILNILRQEIPCKIYLYLLFSFTFSNIEVSKQLELNPTTVSYHLKKLKDAGIIEEVNFKNGKFFPFEKIKYLRHNDHYLDRKLVKREILYTNKNQEIYLAALRVLISNKNSLSTKDIIDTYLDYLGEVKDYVIPKITDGKNKKFITHGVDYNCNSLIDFVQEFLRPPFCA